MGKGKNIIEQLLEDETNGNCMTVDIKIDDFVKMSAPQRDAIMFHGIRRLNDHGSLWARKWIIRGGIALVVLALFFFDHLGIGMISLIKKFIFNQ
jgi:hypothetical protein